MLTFFADESCIDRVGNQKYGITLYGGLVLDEKTFRELTDFFYALKARYFYPTELEMKWRFEKVWDDMGRIKYLGPEIDKKNHPVLYESMKKDFDKFKDEVLNRVGKSKARIIIAIRPEGLLGASNAQKIEYPIAAVAKKFEKILLIEKNYGVILADELKRRARAQDVVDYQYIIKLCVFGVASIQFQQLISIVPNVESRCSPMHQINDMILGAVQYYMLQFIKKSNNEGGQNFEFAKQVVSKIKNNFFKHVNGKYVIGHGILLYPPRNSPRNNNAGKFVTLLEDRLRNDFGII